MADEVVAGGALVPIHDRSVTVPSKNYQRSANLHSHIGPHACVLLEIGPHPRITGRRPISPVRSRSRARGQPGPGGKALVGRDGSNLADWQWM